MCGYDPFWLYDAMLEQEYLESVEQEEKEFMAELPIKTDAELEQLLKVAEEIQSTDMWQKVTDEMNRRLKCVH
jgi:hypothetical protein